MRRQRRRDTPNEVALRRLLYARGLRYRLHRRPENDLNRQADIVFRGRRVAVFVDGCFWHGCAAHGSWPKHNAAWWREKIQKNIQRDLATTKALEGRGWTVVRTWEHDSDEEALAAVIEALGLLA